ncbi:MAG: amidohydrolase family protein [Acidimicrobiales bacterium]|nr:amidohydrolase family protein [Acidimicrobiales bacterium]
MHDLVIRGGTVVDGTGAPPATADVAIDGDTIVAVGRVDAAGRREIDADGALVTPGFVDVHTHYDGQASWDDVMMPSVNHGVTTAVMGNCGVGFAPVRPGGQAFLIELMEAIEDIPGTALAEGIRWDWETFGEYIDSLAGLHRTIDVGTTVPHAAVRAYVMGERAHEYDVTAEEISRIAEVMAAGVREGGLGVSTSRTIQHRSRHGYEPGTFSPDEELMAIGDELASVGRGLFQFVSDRAYDKHEWSWLRHLVEAGVPVTYTMAQDPGSPEAYLRMLDDDAAQSADGPLIVPQVPTRPTGLLYGLESSFHPFRAHPSYREVWDRPHAERVAMWRDPEFKARLLSEEVATKDGFINYLAHNFDMMYPLGDVPDYEPPPEASAAAVAARTGTTPQEVVYDWMGEDDGTAMVFMPLGSYVERDHEAIRKMISHPASIMGLSDGGAHCGLICDASMPTYMLTHWTRDRTRGQQLPVELVVHKQTQATARTYGIHDRGVLAPGMLADVNVIDHAGLTLHAPHMVHDLPAGGRRLLQDVEGYEATVKAGEVIVEKDRVTEARPGRTLKATDAGVIRI